MIIPGQIIQDQSLIQTVRLTANLAQAAGTYTLGTVSGGAIQIIGVYVYVATAGATFTSVAIKTNTTSPNTLMSAVEGAVANLISEVNVPIANANVPITMESGKLLQYIIVGATGTGSLTVTVRYMPLVSGARLA